MRTFYHFFILSLFSIFIAGCATKPIELFSPKKELEKVSILKINTQPSKKAIYRVGYPSQRANDRGYYFNHEYRIIKKRRRHYYFSFNKKKKKIIGLGLSGGGIRANAFGLGILAGLSKKRYKRANLLNRIDYISSVSGGSWANGAYFAENLSDKKFFHCLDLKTKLIKSPFCDHYAKTLRDVQFQLTRDLWEESILHNTLLDNDIKFSSSKIVDRYLLKKPYPIINATHSAVFMEQSTPYNFPFEITPNYIGTIIDTSSGEKFSSYFRRKLTSYLYGEDITGFFINQRAKGIEIIRQKYFDKQDEEGDYLSKYLHVSSAVIGKLLSLTYRFEYKGQPIKNLRPIYVLSDGGKSDNNGVLSLVERGVNLIIISDISADPDVEFDNLKITNEMLKRLLKREIKMRKIYRKGKKIPLISKTYYKSESGKEGDIILIKPTLYNVEEFIKYLKSKRDRSGKLIYSHIIDTLKKDAEPSRVTKLKEYLPDIIESKEEQKKYKLNQDRFPQTPTFLLTYPKNLIYAYYLLGEYISQKYLSREVIRWLRRN